MKKFFSVILFLTLILSAPVYSAEITKKDLAKEKSHKKYEIDLSKLSQKKIIKLIKKTYLEISFPDDFYKNLNLFLQRLKNKSFNLEHARPTFEQLELLLTLVTIFQPNLEILNLSDCDLDKIPSVATEFEKLERLILSNNPKLKDAAIKELMPWLYN
jgi:hypothetical protein